MICDICQREKYNSCPIDCRIHPKINIGSGEMLKKEYINYDQLIWKRNNLETDIIGRVEDVCCLLPIGYFEEIICFHVIEHFRMFNAIKVLSDFYKLLKPEGKLIIEGPDILGSYVYLIETKKNPKAYIDMVFGKEVDRIKYGKGMVHRSGWTQEVAREALIKVGFKVTYTGIGMSHGMGLRDFRVEGIKS